MISQRALAGIQYHGEAGITSHCLNAIVRLVHFGDRIEKACILSHDNEHGFLLFLEYGTPVAVKNGFGSGYPGQGSRGFASALKLLERHSCDIEEYRVERSLLERLENSCLLDTDIKGFTEADPIRPSTWHNYIYYFKDELLSETKVPSTLFPLSVPYGLVDQRIVDLALSFENLPDEMVLKAARRLENIVRERTGLKATGQKLFSGAFLADTSPLYWGDIDGSEHTGRVHLFTSVFMAYRNRRAHQEIDSSHQELLREFLLINELYLLEAEAVERPALIPSTPETPSE